MKSELVESNPFSKHYNKTSRFYTFKKAVLPNWDLYIIFLPVLVYFIIFKYLPMYGVQIAFKDFSPIRGYLGSSWVGLKHFNRFFNSYYFWRLIRNTLGISLYQLIASFPAPIILALVINEVKNKHINKAVQMVTFAPHFISTVVLVGMVTMFLSPRGVINNLISLLGMKRISFMTEPAWFKTIYVFSGIWHNVGWNSIVYVAALSGISLELYEAAIVDGANKFQRLIHISLPGIMPTAIILLIMQTGKIMNIGFEKIFLMQNDLTKSTSDVIRTYVYQVGLLDAQHSFATAVGLFNSVINFILIVTVNKISKKVSETSLW